MRGARNYPCMGHPGKRAPTVELCDDPRGYQPTAIRQHTTRAVPARPQSGRAGHPARRSRRLQRADLCAGGGHAAAARCGSGGNASRCTSARRTLRLARCPARRRPCKPRIAPPPPPGNSLNGTPIPPRAAGRNACRRRCRPRCAKRVQRQRIWRTVGCGRALRPTHGRVHDARRSAGAAEESGRRRGAQDVEGPAADLIAVSDR